MKFIRNLLVVSMVVLLAVPMPSFAWVSEIGGDIYIFPDSYTYNDEPPTPPKWETQECPDRFHKAGNYCVIDQ